MKIKIAWGFRGNAEKLGADSATIRAGQVFDNVEAEYAHLLIGKGLAVEVIEEESDDAPLKPKRKAGKIIEPDETR